MGETSCHVRTAAGLAALPRGLAACYHRAGTRHQLPPGLGVTTAPSVEGLAYLTQTAANKCLWFHGDRDFFSPPITVSVFCCANVSSNEILLAV